MFRSMWRSFIFATFGIMADGVSSHLGTTSGPPRDHPAANQKNTDLRIWDPESHPLRRIYILGLEYIAVANVLGTSTWNELLWQAFWAH